MSSVDDGVDDCLDDDPLNLDTPPGVLWTRVNGSEAVPGVLTPITWSFYGELLEVSARQGFYELGIIPRSDVRCPEAAEDRMFGVFAGHYAANVGVVRSIFNALPGVSGDDVERDMLGSIREGVRDRDLGFRLPAIAVRMPAALLGAGRNSRRCRDEFGRWWAARVDRDGLVGPGTPREALAEAADHYHEALRLQARNRLLFSGATSALVDLAAKAGRPDLLPRLLAGRVPGPPRVPRPDRRRDRGQVVAGGPGPDRAAAAPGAVREIDADLVTAGHLDDPDGAYQLFLPELLHPAPADHRARVRRRTAARARYEALEVPETWSGPVPARPRTAAPPGRAPVARICGLGVAAGVAAGRARVVLDPAEDIDLEVGDVLVCHTTDPSWVALMTLAAALVIDVGGPASHGAVVARELGIPCVIGTHTGTLDLADGVEVRVDGSTGTVEVIGLA